MPWLEIGPTRWVDLLDIGEAAPDGSAVEDIDHHLQPIEPLWRRLTASPPAPGLRPDALWPETLAASRADVDLPAILDALRAARREIAALAACAVTSRRLNLRIHRVDLVFLLSHLARGLDAELREVADLPSKASSFLGGRAGGHELLHSGRLAARSEADVVGATEPVWLVSDIPFRSGLDLAGLDISQPIIFQSCVFEGPVDLTDAFIAGLMSFVDCRFNDGLVLDRARSAAVGLDFSGSRIAALFAARDFRGFLSARREDATGRILLRELGLSFAAGCELDWTGAVVEGRLFLQNWVLAEARLERTFFAAPDRLSPTFWEACYVEGPATFDGANLARLSFADRVVFGGATTFRGCRFGRLGHLDGATFQGPVVFDDARFAAWPSPNDQLQLNIAATASLRRIRTEGRLAIILNASAPAAICLAGARFAGPVVFVRTGAPVRLDLSEAVFDSDAEFRLAGDETSLDLAGTIFKGACRFQPSPPRPDRSVGRRGRKQE